MELIFYEQFGKLRMKQFSPPGTKVTETGDFEWMDGLWIDESIGFTGIRRHEDLPREAGGLEMDFSELPESATLAMLGAIHLPLRPGMTFEEACAVLGEPEETDTFVADRKSYNFTVGSQNPYFVSCTVHEKDGLIHVAVIRKDVLAKCTNSETRDDQDAAVEKRWWQFWK